jgi:AcrR family transcriptional regulator
MAEPSSKPRPLRSDARRNRERVLQAARTLFAEGTTAVEMHAIARRAGVGVGTVYRHFDDREDLLTVLVEDATDDIQARIVTAASAPQPIDAIRQIMRAGIDAYRQYGVLMETASGGKHAGQRAMYIGQARREITALLTGLLQRGVEEQVFRPDLNIRVAIAALYSLTSARDVLLLEEDLAEAVITFYVDAIQQRL